MLTKFCTYPGCNKVIPISDRCCEKHLTAYTERYKSYDKSIRLIRDADITAFYHSPEWQRIRLVVLDTYKGLDLWAYYI